MAGLYSGRWGIEHYINLNRVYGPKPVVFGRETEQLYAIVAMKVAIELWLEGRETYIMAVRPLTGRELWRIYRHSRLLCRKILMHEYGGKNDWKVRPRRARANP
jgi:hypothetical protein